MLRSPSSTCNWDKTCYSSTQFRVSHFSAVFLTFLQLRFQNFFGVSQVYDKFFDCANLKALNWLFPVFSYSQTGGQSFVVSCLSMCKNTHQIRYNETTWLTAHVKKNTEIDKTGKKPDRKWKCWTMSRINLVQILRCVHRALLSDTKCKFQLKTTHDNDTAICVPIKRVRQKDVLIYCNKLNSAKHYLCSHVKLCSSKYICIYKETNGPE